MNQDQVKERLLELEGDVEEFFVVFTGKKSKKVNGLYHPEKRELLLHNKNFSDDNDLYYTAIHEFAHHIHFTRSAAPVASRAHGVDFWALFHGLLDKAEQLGQYSSIFDSHEDFKRLTKKLKNEFLARNGALMKELGGLLGQAEELCLKHNARFEDYVDRALGLHRNSARLLMKMNSFGINPAIGYENMKTVASIKDEDRRREAEAAFVGGRSPDAVRSSLRADRDEADPAKELEREKHRIERTIASLSARLAEIETRLEKLA
jgi:hypothetical protein